MLNTLLIAASIVLCLKLCGVCFPTHSIRGSTPLAPAGKWAGAKYASGIVRGGVKVSGVSPDGIIGNKMGQITLAKLQETTLSPENKPFPSGIKIKPIIQTGATKHYGSAERREIVYL